MIPIWIIMLTSLAAAFRTAAYGVYTWNLKNRLGGVGLFLIALICFGIAVFTLISVLTNL